MLFRLFEPNDPGRRRRLLLAAMLLVASCGGGTFSATSVQQAAGGEAAATDSAGAAGEAAGEAGASGGAVSGGGSGGGSGKASGGTTSSAGAGGKPSTTCNCASGSYCQDGTHSCRLCGDFSRLDFAAPEKLATVSQNQAGNERFPRAASAGSSDLFYRTGLDAKASLWYAASPVSGVGKMLVAASGVVSGPLLAGNFSEPQNFFFDHVSLATGVRQIMAGTWANGILTDVITPPAPLNGSNGDFSVAIAADVQRAYWMSSRNKNPSPDLVWATFGTNASNASAVSLQVQVGSSKCPRLGDDATPWVNSAGTLLLFRAESMDESCNANDSGAFDLYGTPLGKDGLPVAAGVALSELNNTGGKSTETDPSLSQDSCTIYFASDSGKGDFDLYRAARN